MKTFKTSDIQLATYLKINGFRITNVVVGTKGRGIFTFENINRAFIFDFNQKTALVEPIEFSNQMKLLINLIRSKGEICQ